MCGSLENKSYPQTGTVVLKLVPEIKWQIVDRLSSALKLFYRPCTVPTFLHHLDPPTPQSGLVIWEERSATE